MGNEQKRRIYDATGMSSNDQQNADFNFDGFESFSHMFKNAWKSAKSEESYTSKTYEQILEEYERFFSLENELHSHNHVNAKTKGFDIQSTFEITFAEMITGVKKIIGHDRVVRCDSCHGKKVKVLTEQ